MEEPERVFPVQVGGLLQGHQDVVVVGAGLGAEAAGEFAEDHAGTNQAFGVVVVGADSVRILQEGEQFMRVFGQAFAQTPDVPLWIFEMDEGWEFLLQRACLSAELRPGLRAGPSFF